MKKILGLCFIFVLITFTVLISTVKKEESAILDQDDVNGVQIGTSNPSLVMYGQLNTNPKLAYSASQTPIPGYYLRMRLPGKQEVTPFIWQAQDSWRAFSETQSVSTPRRFISNDTSHNNGVVVVNESPTVSDDHYFLIGQEYTLERLTNYRVRVVLSVEVLSTATNIAPIASFIVDNIARGANESGAFNSRRFDNVTSAVYEEGFYVSDTSSPNINVRVKILDSVTATPQTDIRKRIRSIEIFKNSDYQIQNNLDNLFVNSNTNKIDISRGFATLQSEIDAIDALLAGNTISQSVKDGIASKLQAAKTQMTNIRPLYIDVDALFTNTDRTAIKAETVQSSITNLRTRVTNTTMDTEYRTQLNGRLDTAQSLLNVRNEQTTQNNRLTARRTEITNSINALTGLSETEKTNQSATLTSIYNTAVQRVNGQTTVAGATNTGNTELTNLDKVLADATLLSQKNLAIAEINREVEALRDYINGKAASGNDPEIPRLETVSAEKNTEINQYLDDYMVSSRNTINTQTTEELINSNKTIIISNLNTYKFDRTKEAYILTITNRRDEVNQIVDDSTLTNDDKTSYRNFNAQTHSNGLTQFDSVSNIEGLVTTRDAVIQTYTNRVDEINRAGTTSLEDRKTADKEELQTVYTDNIRANFEQLANLTQTQKDAYDARLVEAFNTGNTNIDAATTLVQSIEAKNNAIEQLVNILNESTVTNKINQETARTTSIKNLLLLKISEDSYLSSDKKSTLTSSVTNTYDAFLTRISEATTNASLDTIISEVNTKQTEDFFNISKESLNAKIEVTNTQSINDINALNKLTTEQKNSLIDLVNTNKDERTTDMSTVESLAQLNTIDESNNSNLSNIRNLANSKNDAMNANETYSNDAKDSINALNYITEAKKTSLNNQIDTLFNQASTDINAATTIEAVEEAKVAFNNRVDELLNFTREQDSKISEIYALEADPVRQSVKDAMDAARDAIENATNQTELNTVKTEGTTNVENAILNQDKIDAQAGVDALLREQDSQSTKDLANNFKDRINQAENKADIDALITEAANEIKEAQLAEDKSKSTTELDALSSEEDSAETKKIMDDYKELINNATTPEAVENLLNEAKTKVAEQKLSEDKAKNIESLETAAGDTPSNEVTAIVDEYKSSINNAPDKAEADRLLAAALVKIEEQQLREEKDKAIAEIYALEAEPVRQSVKDAMDAARDAIENTSNQTELNTAKTEGKTNVENAILNQDKIDAQAKVDGLPREQDSQAIKDLADDFKERINQADNKAAIDDLVTQATNEIKAIQLTDDKSSSTTELDNLVTESTTPEQKAIVDEYKEKIDKAQTPEEVETLLDEAKTKVADQKLKEEKAVLIGELESKVGVNITPEMKTIVDQYKDLINNATNKEEADRLLTEGTVSIEAQELKETKDSAISEMTTTAGANPSTNVQEILDEAKKLVGEATNKEDVAQILEEANEAIIAEQLEDYIDQAISDLRQAAGANPNPEVEAILNDYIQRLNNTETKAQAETLKEAGLSDIRTQQLVDAKNSSKSNLDAFAGTTPSQTVTGVLNRYKDLIDKATTQQEVTNLENQAKTAITLQKQKDEAKNRMNSKVDLENEAEVKLRDKYNERVDNATTTDQVTREEQAFDQELENLRNQQNDAPTNYVLAGVLALLGIIALFVMKKKALSINLFPLVILFVFGSDMVLTVILGVLIFLVIVYILYMLLRKKEVYVVEEQPVKKELEQTVVVKEEPKVVYIKEEPKVIYVKEEPKKEVVKEEPKVKKEVKPRPKPVPKPVVIEEEDEVEEEDTEVIIDHENKVKITIRKNYSLTARRHLAPVEVQEFFSEIKNLISSYQEIKLYKSWRYERYKMHGDNILKISVNSSAVKLYFAKNPRKFLDRKYNLEDVSTVKIHEKNPFLMEVSGPRLLDYAKEILQEMLKKELRNPDYKAIKYILKAKTREKLIDEKLIKVTEVRTELK